MYVFPGFQGLIRHVYIMRVLDRLGIVLDIVGVSILSSVVIPIIEGILPMPDIPLIVLSVHTGPAAPETTAPGGILPARVLPSAGRGGRAYTD